MRGLLFLSVSVLGACVSAKPPPADTPNSWTAGGDTDAAPTANTLVGSAAAGESSSETVAKVGGGGSGGGLLGGGAGTASAAASTDDAHVPASFGGASYDRAALEVILQRAARQVKSNCGGATDDNGAVNGPWGKTSVTVKLGHNGHSKPGSVPPPYDGKPSGKCAVAAFANLTFPPFPGSDADLPWPVEIVKP